MREWQGITQRELAETTGIPLATYRRLEAGEIENPRIRHLVNCCIALDVPLEDILEDDWTRWSVLDERAAAAPEPDSSCRGSARGRSSGFRRATAA